MKDENSIFDYNDMIEKINIKKQQANLNEEAFNIQWRIDLYSFFLRNKWLPEFNPEHQPNLWPYYIEYEGFQQDYIPMVVNLL
jgi:hypothetical protein